MTTKYIIKKQLSYTPCRFILGVIAPSRELNPEINLDFLSAVEKEFKVENLLLTQNFPNPLRKVMLKRWGDGICLP